jgi:Asp-tRNA(Asn)/Glu-tRNA(Gln) amidotransferase A subunit family amidase
LTDNAKGSTGLPVGIQVVGMPYEDERVLGAMKLIEGLFPFYRENKFPI